MRHVGGVGRGAEHVDVEAMVVDPRARRDEPAATVEPPVADDHLERVVLEHPTVELDPELERRLPDRRRRCGDRVSELAGALLQAVVRAGA